MICYEKKDHLGKMVVWNKINFYHDGVQLTFYKCSCEYTCISVQCIATNMEWITLQYITWYMHIQHATHYKQPYQNLMVPFLIADHIWNTITRSKFLDVPTWLRNASTWSRMPINNYASEIFTTQLKIAKILCTSNKCPIRVQHHLHSS